jgi:hypothetical protein
MEYAGMMRWLWENVKPVWRRMGKYQVDVCEENPYPRWKMIGANILQGLAYIIWKPIESWHWRNE